MWVGCCSRHLQHISIECECCGLCNLQIIAAAIWQEYGGGEKLLPILWSLESHEYQRMPFTPDDGSIITR